MATIDPFYDINQNVTIHQLKNVFQPEIIGIHDTVQSDLMNKFKSGKGATFQVSPIDMRFMLLTMIKCGSPWTFWATQFNIKTTTFERLKLLGLETVFKQWDKSCNKKEDDSTMYALVQRKPQFPKLSCARYATDVRFQHMNQTIGTRNEVKPCEVFKIWT